MEQNQVAEQLDQSDDIRELSTDEMEALSAGRTVAEGSRVG